MKPINIIYAWIFATCLWPSSKAKQGTAFAAAFVSAQEETKRGKKNPETERSSTLSLQRALIRLGSLSYILRPYANQSCSYIVYL